MLGQEAWVPPLGTAHGLGKEAGRQVVEQWDHWAEGTSEGLQPCLGELGGDGREVEEGSWGCQEVSWWK